MLAIMKYAAPMKRIGVPTMPIRNATAGFALEKPRTMPIPIIDAINPVEARANGKNINAARASPSLAPGTSAAREPTARVDAIAMVAIIEPQ